MDASELMRLISNGETSVVQFKENIKNEHSVAQEMVAFSNSKGGRILIGVNDKTWDITGLSALDLRRLTDLLVNAANEHVKSPIFIETETVDVDGKKVMVVSVPEGTDKPYKDKDGIIFLKNGANKRKVTSNEELARLLQSSGNLYAEERIIPHSTYEDIDWNKFKAFYEETYKEPCEKPYLDRYLQNLRLGANGKLNLAGALLFTDKPQKTITGFFITAIWFWGNNHWEEKYRSSENLQGTLSEQYRKGYDFVLSKLQKVQAGQSFNSIGKSEIPEIVIQELLANALIHRDYFIQDTIKLFVFENRIEIKSPGKLPNNLTEAQIRRGIRKKRNNILDSFAPQLLNYRGAGSGILRALEAWPQIDFINDIEAEQFTVIIHRTQSA
ncbi:MAG: putative DNA binding domain-containing protein [Bacteroidia bacterium]